MTEVAVIIGSGSIGQSPSAAVPASAAHLLLADYNETGHAGRRRQQLRGRGLRRHHPPPSTSSDQASVAELAQARGRARRRHPRRRAPPGVSPVQATTERVLHVDLLRHRVRAGGVRQGDRPRRRRPRHLQHGRPHGPAAGLRRSRARPGATPRPTSCSPCRSSRPRRVATPVPPTRYAKRANHLRVQAASRHLG